MNSKLQFAERLKKAMIDAGYEPRASVLEKGFNTHFYGNSISFQSVSSWLKGESFPTQEKLEVLADWLNVDPHELRYGDLPATIKSRKKRWEDALAGQDREVLEAFVALPAEQKKVARAVILALGVASGAKP